MSFNSNGEESKGKVALNENYASDVAETFQYTRWLLKVLGIWPMVKMNPKKWETYVGKILIVTCFLLMCFILIPVSVHTIFKEKTTLGKVALYSMMSYALSSILKYFAIIVRREALKRCVEHVRVDWMAIETKNDREIMMRNVKAGHHITVLCGMFLYVGGISYHMIIPLWRGSEINEFNETIRPFADPGYDIFFNVNTSPTYEIVFSVMSVSVSVLFVVTTTACNLAATFVTHAGGQFEIIESRFETFFDKVDESNEMRESNIGSVIASHVRVLRLTSMIESLLCEICLVEVGTSVLIICFLEYCCLMTWSDNDSLAIVTYIALLLSTLYNAFIFCYVGELLKEQCARIADVAYMMGWYRLPGKTGLALIMIIAMADCSRKLTAGGIFELSVYSFGSIIRTSMTYLNLLRTTTG